MSRKLNHDSSEALWTEERRGELPRPRFTLPIGLLGGLVAVSVLYFTATATDTLTALGALTLFALVTSLAYVYPGVMLIAVVVTSILIPVDLALKVDVLPRLGPTRGMVAAFLLGAFLHHKTRTGIFKSVKGSTLAVPIALYFVAAFISTIFSAVPLKSAYSFISLIFEEFLFFFAFVYFAAQERFRVNLKKTLLWTTIVVCLFAFYEEVSHYNPILLIYPEEEMLFRGDILRVRSTFFHPIAFGCFLSFIFPFLLAEFIQTNNYARKYVVALLLMCVLVASFLTVSRGPWVSFLLSSLIFIVWWTRRNLNRKMLAGAVICIFLIFSIFFASLSRDISKSPVGKIINPSGLSWRHIDEDSSEYYRIALFKAVVDRLKGSRWIYGFGPGTFHLAQVESVYAGHEHVLTAADSHYIRLLFEFGLLGVLTFLLLLGAILSLTIQTIRKAQERDKPFALASAGAIFGFLLTNISVSMFGYLPLHLLFWLSVAYLINVRKWASQRPIM